MSRLHVFRCLFAFLALGLVGSALSAQPHETNRPYSPPSELSLTAVAEAIKELAAGIKSPGKLEFDINVHLDGMVAVVAAILVFPIVLFLMPRKPTN